MKQHDAPKTDAPKPLTADDLAALERRTERQNLSLRSGVRAGALKFRY